MEESTIAPAPRTTPVSPGPAPRPCPSCGVIDQPTEGPGSGPHTASLRCGGCQHFLCWHSTKTPAERQQARLAAMAQRPPSPAQLAYLAALGDAGPAPGSMAEASTRIDALVYGEVLA